MRRLFTCAAVAAAIVGCAKRAPEPVGVPAGVPHVSWIIMHGDRENPDADFACQSTGPRTCVLPASRTDARVFSDVHLYFHGAGSDTTYRGTYSVDFLNEGNAAAQTFPIQTNVKGDEEIANHTLTGIVTAKPGTYVLRLALDATTATGSTPIREDVPVRVQ